MAEFLFWIQSNYPTVFGGLAELVGFVFTFATFHQNAAKADREEYSILAAQHQILWKEARDREDLKRVCQADVNLIVEPLTLVERLYLNEVFIYCKSGWKLSKRNTVLRLTACKASILSRRRSKRVGGIKIFSSETASVKPL